MAKVSPHTNSILKKRKCKVGRTKKKKPYVKSLMWDEGYNILEYYGVIRKHLQWKYNLLQTELELMYFLYPKNYFTRKDFDSYPLKWDSKRMVKLMEKDMIEKLFPERKRNVVFRLTRKSKLIVQMAHQLLSGEMKMTVAPSYNKVFRESASYSQKRFRTIMEDMRELVGEKFPLEKED